VFADIDPRTANIDPDSVEKVITPDTCAIIAVHNFGNPADIEALERIALDHGMPLIFDSAHGFGSLYRGEPLGAQGSVQVFSMSPTKLLVAGEGGIVATNDDELAHMVRMGRDYGMGEGYDSQFAGLNARLPEISALMALHGLNNLEQSVKRRNEIAGVYRSRLAEIPGLGFQQIDPENRSSYKDFTIFIDEGLFGVSRDTLSKELRYRNIDTRAYYNPPVHKQTAYKSFYKGEDLHHTEDLSNSALSVPIWSHMPDDVVEGVCDSILDIQANGAGDKKIQRDLS
jgi:dTDP-4-amino-4,6-dideoxygalactose transaminase